MNVKKQWSVALIGVLYFLTPIHFVEAKDLAFGPSPCQPMSWETSMQPLSSDMRFSRDIEDIMENPCKNVLHFFGNLKFSKKNEGHFYMDFP